MYKNQLSDYNRDKNQYNRDLNEFNRAVRKRNQLSKQQIDKYLANASKEIIGKWFLRDSLGNMSINLMEEKAHFSASDQDVNIAKYSAINRISSLGKQLIEKTYVIVHTVDNIYTYREFYNEKDRENLVKLKYQKEKTIPVLREKEGFIMKEKSFLYKLNFSDSIFSDFINKYYLSESETEQRKVRLSNWEKASFPMIYFSNHNYSDEKSQYTQQYLDRLKNDAEFRKQNPLRIASSFSRVPLNKLKQTLGSRNFTAGVLNANIKKIEDFKLKAAINTAYPITSKVGTKEGVKKNDRWAIYEIQLDKKGYRKKKKIGYARVTKVANNDSIASGNSPSSTFRQHSGKQAYSGMLMEPKDGGIFNFGFGTAISIPTNKAFSGSYFDFDFRLFTFYKLGFNRTSNSFSINNFGGLQRDSIYYFSTDDSTSHYFSGNFISEKSVSGKTNYFTFNFGREFLIGDRGNLIIEPKIGIGRSLYKFDNESFADSSINSIVSNSYNLLRIKAHVTMYSLEIGYHLLPKIIVSVKPALIVTKAYQTGALLRSPNNENSDYRDVKYLGSESSWGFDKMHQRNITLPINIGVKFKL